MEEVEDIIPETVPEEFPEEVEEMTASGGRSEIMAAERTAPEPPPLVRGGGKLKEKVTCEGCGKSLSLHAYKYSHKCKARAPDEPPKEAPKEVKEEPKKKVANVSKLTEGLKKFAMSNKPAMTEAQSQKPIRQKTVIQRTPEYHPEPPYQPTQQEIYQHLIQQRQQQAYMRHQAMLAPYQNMFASRAR